MCSPSTTHELEMMPSPRPMVAFIVILTPASLAEVGDP
jgi:hypothetical protein